MSFTLIVIIITAIVSIIAFNNSELMSKLILWPRVMDNPAEYYRLISSGFIHADWPHLFFNMFTLYFFGENIEVIFAYFDARYLFILLYLTGIVVASLPSFLKNRNNNNYRSLGASGGVSAVLFATIYYLPWSKISMMFIPIGIPAILFGALYIAYSAYMQKAGRDNVNHNAHLWGSIYGFAFASVFDLMHGGNALPNLLHPQF
jgi:membrane associated rhomboid family serine protease